MSQNSLGEKLK